MTQKEKRKYLIKRLLDEDSRYRGMAVPDNEHEEKRILRSLFNIRLPRRIDKDFLEIRRNNINSRWYRKANER